MSVIIRRRRPKRAQRNLLDLPAEILATVWQYVLNTPKGDQEHHIYFNRSCMSHNGSLMWKKIELWRFRFQERIKYLLFSRWVCPPLVLVNKQIYREALTYLSHAQTFEVGDEECLRSFISLAPNQLIPSSTAFDAGYVDKNKFDRTKATFRKMLDAAYGTKVKLFMKSYDPSIRTKQTARKSTSGRAPRKQHALKNLSKAPPTPIPIPPTPTPFSREYAKLRRMAKKRKQPPRPYAKRVRPMVDPDPDFEFLDFE